MRQSGRVYDELLVLQVQPVDQNHSRAANVAPGTIIPWQPGRLLVSTGSTPLEIVRVQPAGKRPMSAAEFLRGNPLPPNSRFGPQ